MCFFLGGPCQNFPCGGSRQLPRDKSNLVRTPGKRPNWNDSANSFWIFSFLTTRFISNVSWNIHETAKHSNYSLFTIWCSSDFNFIEPTICSCYFFSVWFTLVFLLATVAPTCNVFVLVCSFKYFCYTCLPRLKPTCSFWKWTPEKEMPLEKPTIFSGELLALRSEKTGEMFHVQPLGDSTLRLRP